MLFGWIFFAVLLIGFGLWLYAPFYFYNIAIKRRTPLPGTPAFLKAEARQAMQEDRPWIDRQPYERAVIVSHDGLTLEGLFVAAAAKTPRLVQDTGQGKLGGTGQPISADTVILAHGYTGDSRQLSEFARRFHERGGYNVLLPNARGHGSSQGNYVGFGWPDRLDYLRWIDWVIRRVGQASPETSGPIRIVLYGISMGASTVLMTGGEAALPPEVRVIIEDCGYTSAEDELRYQARRFYHLRKADRLFKALCRLAEKRAGFKLEEASALNQVRKIRIPTMFIHGDADTFVPFAMVQTLYDACPAAKELYVAKGAGHGMSCETDRDEYERRIAAFLDKYLPQPAAKQGNDG